MQHMEQAEGRLVHHVELHVAGRRGIPVVIEQMERAADAVVFPHGGILAALEITVIDEIFALLVEELAHAEVIGEVAGALQSDGLLHIELHAAVVAVGAECAWDGT